ncbi:branched-chain amino acid ABC transporter permease [Chloroflexota bacterium]
MAESNRINIRELINFGLLASVISLSFSVIGMVELFSKRDLVAGVLSLGQVFLFAPTVALAYQAAKKSPGGDRGIAIFNGLIVGLASSLLLIILLLIDSAIDLRQFLPNVSPTLIGIITFNLGTGLGIVVLIGATGLLGLITAGMYILPSKYRSPIFSGILWTLVIGMFSEILSERIRAFFGAAFVKLIFTGKSLKAGVGLGLFILVTALSYWWQLQGSSIKENITKFTSPRQRQVRWGYMIGGLAILLILPLLLGTYLSEVVNNVLIYVLMGFGLNIVVGFAGLLDLGYVAFFAIGAYTMALLTSSSSLAVASVSFWAALPICVLVAVFFGLMLGIPVLRMRGDYLAIVTLGFGEIIRILALSDLLKPFIGGAQGILQINKPSFFGTALVAPTQFYYIVVVGCLLAAFVSWRLSESRLGRQWMALREDEDVAEAMGINLVATKLLAFAIGAAFSGLSGAIFAAKLTSIFPHSFNLLVSINVLCLIIVGGMGSLPGVVVGALALVGLPELLREFAEYRMLAYGALLIVMMLQRPEGLWPSAVRKRELYIHEEEALSAEVVPKA